MMSGKRLVVICAFMLLTNLTILSLYVKFASIDNKFIIIDEVHDFLTTTIPDNFLSVGMDASEIQHFDKVNLSSVRLRALASELSPARLRLGGTMSERLIFSSEIANKASVSCTKCDAPIHTCKLVNKLCKKKFLPFFLMTAGQWKEINDFCKDTNLKLLFTLNVLIRDGNGWDDSNAREIINFSKFHNYKIDWQLGNEPNSFPHTFNVSISPKQLAEDFRHLRKLLNELGYRKSLLVGPDTTRPQVNRPECLEYMAEFLGNTSHGINVRAWHQYYLNSRTAKLDDFWNPETFNLLKGQIEVMRKRTHSFNWMPMWLSETSSSYGGGAPSLSDSFASSPLWLDKLGLSARHNITTVIRQSFIGGNYSLVDRNFDPLPDWWVSVLFKKLVGNRVLKIKHVSTKYQRFYAHCAKINYGNSSNAVTLYGMNLELSKLKFLLKGSGLTDEDLMIDEYILSAPSNNRKSKVVLLNGIRLVFENALPEFKPRRLKNVKHIVIPPYSVGFWVIKNTSLAICRK